MPSRCGVNRSGTSTGRLAFSSSATRLTGELNRDISEEQAHGAAAERAGGT
jgi:hypothetical protein